MLDEWFGDWAGRLADVFRDRAGRSPEGVWAAPGRVNLIGEHTDYNDGFVLPLAIDRHVVVAAAPRGDGRLRCWSLQEEGPAESALTDLGPGVRGVPGGPGVRGVPGGPGVRGVPGGHGRSQGWAAYVQGVAWALGQVGVEIPGADVVVDSDLPAGAGLSSSAALEVAVALALTALTGADVDSLQLARVAQRAESEVVGMPCGIMDQLASVAGRAGCAVLVDCRTLEAEPVPLGLEEAGLRLLVIDTRVRRRLVEAPYAERRESCREAARRLGVPALRDVTLTEVESAATRLGEPGHRRARHVVSENGRVLEVAALLRAGRVADVGPHLGASHASLRHDFEASCPELDLAVDTAMAAGATGARLTGAGFGGAALALVPGKAVDEVAGALRRAFDENGFSPPEVLEVTPVDGAHRVA